MSSTIAIIGNGLDLNLGLKTSYTDFLNSQYFPDDTDETSLCMHLKRKASLQNWVDIELELASYSQENQNRQTLHNEFKALKNALMQYISSIPTIQRNGLTPAHEFAQKLSKTEDICIVNFNYTNTAIDLLYMFDFSKDEPNKRHWHIHGSCRDKNIIFGIDDQSNVSNDHIFLFKSFHFNFSGRGLTEKLIQASEIHFFGHSLGHPDHMYFRNYFDRLASVFTETHIIFYYFGETGYFDLYRQLRTLTSNRVSAIKNNAKINFVDVSQNTLSA